MCFCYLNHHFVNAVELVGNLFLMSVSIWITESECFPTFLMCWIQISNHFSFELSGTSSNIKQSVFLLCEPSFCHCCKVGWKLVSVMWEHMNYWKSHCFDVLSSNIKSFLLLVECKILKQEMIRCLNHDVVTAVKLFGN